MGNIRYDPHAKRKKERQTEVIPREQPQRRPRQLPPPNQDNNVLELCQRRGSTLVKKYVDQERENAKRLEQQLRDQAHRDEMKEQGVRPLTALPSRFGRHAMVTTRRPKPVIRKRRPMPVIRK